MTYITKWFLGLSSCNLSGHDRTAYIGIMDTLAKKGSITDKQYWCVANMCNYQIKTRRFKPFEKLSDGEVFTLDTQQKCRFNKSWMEIRNAYNVLFYNLYKEDKKGAIFKGKKKLYSFDIEMYARIGDYRSTLPDAYQYVIEKVFKKLAQ